MHKTVIALGFVILIIGLVIAFNNSIRIDTEGHWEDSQGNWYNDPISSDLQERTGAWYVPGSHTVIYPYLIAGGIVSLIGFVTSVIGYYMKAKETELKTDYVKYRASICPSCGTENPHRSKFCIKCGSPLEKEVENSNTSTQQKKKQKPFMYFHMEILLAIGCSTITNRRIFQKH